MKSIKQLRESFDIITEKDEVEDRRFASLVRAGLFDAKKLPMLKKALEKDSRTLTPVERNTLLDLLDSLMHQVISSPQVYNRVKQNVTEASTKEINLLGPDPRNKTSDHKNIPTVLVLRRKAVRMYPDNQQVVLYYAQSIDKYVSIPFGNDVSVAAVNEEINIMNRDSGKMEPMKRSAGENISMQKRLQKSQQQDAAVKAERQKAAVQNRVNTAFDTAEKKPEPPKPSLPAGVKSTAGTTNDSSPPVQKADRPVPAPVKPTVSTKPSASDSARASMSNLTKKADEDPTAARRDAIHKDRIQRNAKLKSVARPTPQRVRSSAATPSAAERNSSNTPDKYVGDKSTAERNRKQYLQRVQNKSDLKAKGIGGNSPDERTERKTAQIKKDSENRTNDARNSLSNITKNANKPIGSSIPGGETLHAATRAGQRIFGSDYIGAGLRYARDKIQGKTDTVTGKPTTYRDSLDAERNTAAKWERDHPIASKVGKIVAGIGAAAIATKGMAPKAAAPAASTAASTAGALTKGAAIGSGAGGVIDFITRTLGATTASNDGADAKAKEKSKEAPTQKAQAKSTTYKSSSNDTVIKKQNDQEAERARDAGVAAQTALATTQQKKLKTLKYKKPVANDNRINTQPSNDNIAEDVMLGGVRVKINKEVSKKIVTVFESLNKQNQRRMLKMLNESDESYNKIISFVARH
jgi:hypothetical protein